MLASGQFYLAVPGDNVIIDLDGKNYRYVVVGHPPELPLILSRKPYR
jgi:hypothetical protein